MELNKTPVYTLLVALLGILIIVSVYMFTELGNLPFGDINSNNTTFLNFNNIPNSFNDPDEILVSATPSSLNQTWLDFDGTNQNIEASNLNNLFENNLIYNLTYVSKLNLAQLDKSGTLLYYGDGLNCASNNKCFQLAYNYNAGNERFQATIGDGTDRDVDNDAVNSTGWTDKLRFFGYTFRDGMHTFYRNATNYSQVSSSNGYSNVTSADVLIFGGTGNGVYLNGSLDNILVYNQSLSQVEIGNIYFNDVKDTPFIENIDTNRRAFMWFYNDTRVYGTVVKTLYQSDDGGLSWSSLGSIGGTNGVTGLWADSNFNYFVIQDNTIRRSVGNFTNWTTVLNINESRADCNYASYRYGSMTETNTGALLYGTYTQGGDGSAENESCHLVFRSTDSGSTWNVVYNGTAHDTHYQHVHFVQTDPYTGYVYLSLGDHIDTNGLWRSTNDGQSFNLLKSGHQDGINWKLTAIQFGDGYRIIGEDWSIGGDDTNSSIFKTTDDENYRRVYTAKGEIESFFEWFLKDSRGNYISASGQNDNDTYPTIWASEDEGETWYVVYNLQPHQYAGERSFSWPSNFDSNDYVMIYPPRNETNVGIDNYKIRYTGFSNTNIFDYRLNENQGTTAYDSSPNANNGTITGATWNNDNTYVNLPSTSYSLDVNDDIIITDSEYDASQIRMDWRAYGPSEAKSSANNIVIQFLAYPALIGLVGVIVLLGVVVVVMIRSFRDRKI